MIEFAKLAGSAFFGVIVGLIVQWWKSRRDELRILCDEFCRTVEQAADLASTYWLSPPSDSSTQILEARLVALQRRIDGYRVLLKAGFPTPALAAIAAAAGNLFDAMTGGDFKSKSRRQSSDRAVDAQYHASELILSIRTGFQEAVTFRSTIRRWCNSCVLRSRPSVRKKRGSSRNASQPNKKRKPKKE